MRDREGLPKPFLTLADAEDDDLLAGLRVFGLATEWMPAVEHAFVDALRHRLPWHRVGVDPPRLAERFLETCEGIPAQPPAPGAAVLHWITPYDAENLDPRKNPQSILTRLHRRLTGMALWHDTTLDPLDPETLVQWTEIADTSTLPPPRAQASRSGRQHRRFETQAITGTVILRGDLRTFWPLLRLGERCATGRGAVRGWGRYRLHPV